LAGLSDRQIRRLIKRIRRMEMMVSATVREAQVQITGYPQRPKRRPSGSSGEVQDFNLTHATEQLAENHRIAISRETSGCG